MPRSPCCSVSLLLLRHVLVLALSDGNDTGIPERFHALLREL